MNPARKSRVFSETLDTYPESRKSQQYSPSYTPHRDQPHIETGHCVARQSLLSRAAAEGAISAQLQKTLDASDQTAIDVNIMLDSFLGKQQAQSLVNKITPYISNPETIDYLPRMHLLLCTTSAQSIAYIARLSGVEFIDLN